MILSWYEVLNSSNKFWKESKENNSPVFQNEEKKMEKSKLKIGMNQNIASLDSR